MSSKLDVRGISAIVKNLELVGEAIESSAIDAQMKAALEVEREAVLIVQVDTGRLKNSVDVQKVGDVVEVGSGVKAGTRVNYAHFVEFGTSRSRAYPFMRPAVEKVRSKYPQIVIDEVKMEIR